MGPLLRAVNQVQFPIDHCFSVFSIDVLLIFNQIARALATDFPLVAVDTLAYQYDQFRPKIGCKLWTFCYVYMFPGVGTVHQRQAYYEVSVEIVFYILP